MLQNLLGLNELKELTGYDDDRSIIKWCKEKRIPIVPFGKKKYIVKEIIEIYIEQYLKAFLAANYMEPNDIIESIKLSDKARLSELLLESPKQKTIDNITDKSHQHSKAAQELLNNINRHNA
jgi:hypothetical protein